MNNITVIGLGRMGTAIASRILAAGMQLTVFNRTPRKVQPLVEKGAHAAKSIEKAVQHADVVISCLLDDAAVIEITLGDSGILAYMKPSAIHIGTATILPNTAERIANAHRQHGSHYISAAVLGIPKVAYQGELTTFCAGKASIIEKCDQIFKTFSNNVINLGEEPKTSAVMKISMNTALITLLELVSELYVFAEKSGVAVEIVQQGLHQIYGHSGFKRYIDKIKERDFDQVNFNMKGGFKDISVFQKAFTDAGTVPRLANLLKERYISALANGLDQKDWCAIYEVIRRESGLD